MSAYNLALFHRALDLMRRDAQAEKPSGELANLLAEFWAVAQEEKPPWAAPFRKTRLWQDEQTKQLHPEVFQALQRAGEKFWPTQYPKPKVPTPQEMHRQGVPEWQICHTWGLMHNGAPDLARLREELEKGGTHTRNKKPLPVQQVEAAQQERLQEWKKLCQQLAEKLPAPDLQKKPNPETLLRQGANLDQVAQVCSMTREEVQTMAKRLNIPAQGAAQQLADPKAPGNTTLPEAAESHQAWATAQRETPNPPAA